MYEQHWHQLRNCGLGRAAQGASAAITGSHVVECEPPSERSGAAQCRRRTRASRSGARITRKRSHKPIVCQACARPAAPMSATPSSRIRANAISARRRNGPVSCASTGVIRLARLACAMALAACLRTSVSLSSSARRTSLGNAAAVDHARDLKPLPDVSRL